MVDSFTVEGTIPQINIAFSEGEDIRDEIIMSAVINTKNTAQGLSPLKFL